MQMAKIGLSSAMAVDFDPGFSFDAGQEAAPPQAPWDMTGVIHDSEKAHAGTSLDAIIQRRVQAKRKRGGAPFTPETGGNAIPLGIRRGAVQLRNDTISDEEAGFSSDSDAPLPGELDGDGEASDQQDLYSDESSDEQWQSQEMPSRPQQQRQAHANRAGSDAEDSGDSEDDEEPAPPRPGKKQKQSAADARPAALQQATGAGGSDQAAQVKGARQVFAKTPEGTTFSAKSFSDLHLSRPLIRACQALGYQHPTPIQAACIPLALTGRDICGSAITGSGKTAAFSLPILERLLFRSRKIAATYALILTPTRELAVQVHSMIQNLAQFTDVRAALVVGGLSSQLQASTLRSNPEVVVATPGRLIDHLRNTQSVGLEDLQLLVLDEADRLLEMGFAEEIREIVRQAPRKRQTMLFSATMTEQVQELVTVSLQRPVRLAADPSGQAPVELTQEIVRLKGSRGSEREAVLLALCARSFRGGRTIVFFRTKQRAHRAKILFGLAGLPSAAELHGDMSQAARLESLDRFRKGEVAFLLATDVAARGLDILGVEAVLNYDTPSSLPSYLHRIGRTARAGRNGRAVTFIEDSDRALVKEVVKKVRVQLQNRLVPAAAVKQMTAKIEGLEDDLHRIVQEERAERELRKAEMQAQKAENIMEHEAEIYARPARTWFQTERQKRQAAKGAREAATSAPDIGAAVKGVAARKGGSQGRAAATGKKGKLTKQEQQALRVKKNTFMEETKDAVHAVRAVKTQQARLRESGMTPGLAGKAAAAAALAASGKTPKQSQKAKAKAAKAGQDKLFEGDGISKSDVNSAKVYAGGGRSGKLNVDTSKGKAAKNKFKRHGSGKHAFKSKAKHKRRH